MIKHLENKWNKIKHKAYPPQASTQQRRDMKRAFYHGAQAFYELALEQKDTDQLLNELSEEFEWYVKEVREGRE